MTRKRGDYVGVIEAAYVDEPDEGRWLSGLLEAAAPLLDHGHGVAALTYKTTGVTGMQVQGYAASPGMKHIERDARAYLDVLEGPLLDKLFRRTDALFLRRDGSGPIGEHPDDYAYWSARGVTEAFSVVGYDVSGHGVMLTATTSPGARVGSSARASLRGVAAHIASAIRLRRAAEDAAPEAVIDASGAVVEAHGRAASSEGRRALAAAAKGVRRARGREVSRDEAVRLWKALWAGRWTLVDHKTSGDSRLLVARKNDPAVAEPKALTLAERQVVAYAAVGHAQKFIAFELGLVPSTVAQHLASAMRKLGVKNRIDLAALVASDEVIAGDPPSR